MSAPATVPVTVTPEAAAHVAQLGYQVEFDQILEYTRQVIPDLVRIDVVLQPPYDTGDDPSVIMEATRAQADFRPEESIEWEWSGWKIARFPPDVFRHFQLMVLYGGRHGG